jgi:hypothetical protein
LHSDLHITHGKPLFSTAVKGSLVIVNSLPNVLNVPSLINSRKHSTKNDYMNRKKKFMQITFC